MALNITDLFTVIGKYVKTINTWNTLLSTTLEAQKDEIYTVLDAEDLQDLYIDLPSQFEGFKDAVASWISTLIGEVEDLLTDETYVLEELPIFATDVTTVLNAIFDQMVADSDTIESSVVSIGGADADTAKFTIERSDGSDTTFAPTVFVSRTLDGVNDPSSLVDSHINYNGQESQLAMSCDVFAKVTSVASPGSETVQVFADSPTQASYTGDTESPGTGPVLSNAESANLVADNYDFSDWSGDNPTGWTLTGGSAGVDWEDLLSTGEGPLRINTAGTYAKQQITGLSRNTNYFFGAFVEYIGTGGTAAAKFRLENVDGVTVHKNFGTFNVADVTLGNATTRIYLYGFYQPTSSVNLNDLYITVEHDAESDAGTRLLVYKVICAPVQYFNGLGFTFWKPMNSTTSNIYAEMGSSPADIEMTLSAYNSIAVSNNNNGVFQTFFRKAFNIQLPTADAPTIDDALAT